MNGKKSNKTKNSIQKRRERIRTKLRARGYLPPVGHQMTEEQKIIYQQIGNDDYTFWDIIKKNHTASKLDDHVTKQTIILTSKDYQRILFERVKKSAKKRKLEFSLTIDDIIIPKYCPLLEIKLTYELTYETKDSYFSIDRINSNLGYVKGNIQVISFKANTMKSNATKEELLIFSKNIIRLNS